MKKTLLSCVAVLALAAGCGGKKTTTPSASADPLALPPAPAHPATPAPEAAPVRVEAPTNPGPITGGVEAKPSAGVSATVVPGQKYKVKKGDTLFSLAKAAYGNGNKYTKIVSANPTVIKNGVLPEGATIVIPN